MFSISLAFKRHIQDHFAARFELTNRVTTSWVIVIFGDMVLGMKLPLFRRGDAQGVWIEIDRF
jgi:hypothetical protein